MTTPADESPTERQPASPTCVGSASVPPGGSRRRRQWEDTLDLPVPIPVDLPSAPRTVPYPPPPPPPPPPATPTRRQPALPPARPPQPPQIQYVPVRPPGYGPPPPGYGPPQFRRRRRKWPWVILVMLGLCAGCCGGSYAWARPYWVQYPTSVNLEATVPALTRTKDAAALKTAGQLQTSLTSDHLDESGFTIAYTDGNRNRTLVFGATRLITDPTRDLEASLRKLGTKIVVQDVVEVDAGVLGGEQRCAASRLDGKAATVCGWADHGSIAIAVFGGKSTDAAATSLQNLRAAITVRD